MKINVYFVYLFYTSVVGPTVIRGSRALGSYKLVLMCEEWGKENKWTPTIEGFVKYPAYKFVAIGIQQSANVVAQ